MNLEVGNRPWGRYQVLFDGPQCKVKLITVHAGQRLSYQTHARRREHWTIVSGLARVTLNGEVRDLQPGDAIDIPQGAAHRIENAHTGILEFVEVQLGDYFGEDDIVRLSDDYGRAKT